MSADERRAANSPLQGSAAEELMAKFASTIEDAMKLKRVMLKKGMVRARAECPKCGGWLQGRLSGPPKNHMRFWCEGTCGRRMME